MQIAKVSTRGTLDVFIGNLVGTAVSTIGLLVLARVLGPASFGLVAVVMVLPSLTLLVQDFAISHAITRYVASYRTKGQGGRVRNVIIAGALFEILSALALWTITFFSAQPFATTILLKPELAPLIRAASWTIIGEALLTFGRAVLMGVDRLGRYAFVLVQSAVFRGILPAILVMIGYGLEGAIIGATVGAVASGLVSLVALFGQIPARSSQSARERESLALEFRTMTQYSAPLYFSLLAGGALPQFLTIVAAVVLNPWTLGNYSAALRLGNLMGFVSMPILTALFPAFSKVDPVKAKANLESLYKYGIKYTATAVVPLTALLILMSQPLVLILYGLEYAEAGLYLGLTFAVFFNSAMGSLVVGAFLRGQGKTRAYLIVGVVTLLTGVPLALVLAPLFQAVGLLVASLIANLLAIAFSVAWVASHYHFLPDWRASAKLLFSALVSLSVSQVLLLSLSSYSLPLRISLAVAVFLVTYFLFFVGTRPLTKRDFDNIVFLSRGLGKISAPLLFVLRKLRSISAKQDDRQFDKESQACRQNCAKAIGRFTDSRSEQVRIAETCSLLPPGASTALDVGCFDGRLTEQLMKQSTTVVGIDISVEPLRNTQADVLVSSVEKIPFVDKSFDCAVCTEVLEHLKEHQYYQGLAEMQRVARHWILLSVPLAERLDEGLVYCHRCGRYFHVWGHVRAFSAQELVRLFDSFQPVKSRAIWKVATGNRIITRILNKTRASLVDSTQLCPYCNTRIRSNLGERRIAVALRMLNEGMKILKSRLGITTPYWMIVLFKRRNVNERAD